jgi:hypothetical protein
MYGGKSVIAVIGTLLVEHPAAVKSHGHCEEQRDEAIQSGQALLDCFAEPVIGPATSGPTRRLAMTRNR